MSTHHTGPAAEVRALDLFIKLVRCANVVEAGLQRRLARHGVTSAQLAVLEALLHLGPLTQSELGAKMLRSGGSVTTLLDTLERKGLVRRERSEEDRRVSLVYLTASGGRLIRRVFPHHVRNVVRSLSPLTAAEQTELARLCKKLGLGQDDVD